MFPGGTRLFRMYGLIALTTFRCQSWLGIDTVPNPTPVVGVGSIRERRTRPVAAESLLGPASIDSWPPSSYNPTEPMVYKQDRLETGVPIGLPSLSHPIGSSLLITSSHNSEDGTNPLDHFAPRSSAGLVHDSRHFCSLDWRTFGVRLVAAYKFGRVGRNNAALPIVDHQVGLMGLVRDYTPQDMFNSIILHASLGKTYDLVVITTSSDKGNLLPIASPPERRFNHSFPRVVRSQQSHRP